MTKKVFSVFAFILFLTINFPAQTTQPSPMPTRSRMVGSGTTTTTTTTPSKGVIVTNTMPSPMPTAKPSQTPISNPIPVDRPVALPTPTPVIPQNNYKILSLGQIKQKIAEAKRLMQTRPMPTGLTGSTDGAVAMDVVRLAFYDWKTQKLDFVVLTKTAFLSKNAELSLISSNGKAMYVRIIRANGVNTPVTIFDQTGEIHTPLVVQYPVERGGRYMETAYYISTHRASSRPKSSTPESFTCAARLTWRAKNCVQKGIIIAAADCRYRRASLDGRTR